MDTGGSRLTAKIQIHSTSGLILTFASTDTNRSGKADPAYLGIKRSAGCIFIQVTLNEGRPVEKKVAFFRAIADGLHSRLGVRREDVFINLIEVKKENWSFGNGEAQYLQP